MPSASERLLMVLAVNIPEQEPAPGQAAHSYVSSSSAEILPLLKRPTASKTLSSPVSLPWTLPGSIGPPDKKIEGMFSRAAAMSMPGMILSQDASKTRPSKGCATAMVSTVSAINSLLGSEYFMPAWFMAMPSQMPMVLKTSGVPPAAYMPALTASTSLSKCICPGMISLNELAMPMIGRSNSHSVKPSARNKERWGALSGPLVIKSLRFLMVPVP